MAITVVCDCGKEFKVKDELAGKKVKCPACQTVLTVPQPEEEMAEGPPPKARKQPAAVEEDEDQGDEIISRKDKKKGGKKSNTLLFVGIGCGLLLLCVGCPGLGVGVYFLFLRGGGDPETVLVGKWKVDVEETKKNLSETDKKDKLAMEFGVKIMESIEFEFKDDKTYTMKFGDFPPAKGKWKMKSKDGSKATLELTQDGSNETKDSTITVISNNRIRITGTGGGKDKQDMVLKRA
jgi:hypothetical protein